MEYQFSSQKYLISFLMRYLQWVESRDRIQREKQSRDEKFVRY
jgi:hypothetical protein